jgi:hypothetical protein
LSGRVNMITCPHCGYRGVVGTPLMYHDAAKSLAIAYMPMELNLEQQERERVIGEMTNALMRALPEDAPKGHLLQPKTALTMQGMLDQILEADGITPEMLEAERRKVQLIDQLADASSEERMALLDENEDLLDLGFLELLMAAAQAASQAEDGRRALRLLNVRDHLMETTEAGQMLQAQQQALAEASEELRALGEGITREAFVDLLIRAADDPLKVDALATLARPLLDYTTFQLLTQRINATEDAETRQRYSGIRDRMVEINAAYEERTRAMAQRAADTLRMLIQAPDVSAAIQANLNRIDDVFLQVLQLNLEEARKAGNVQVSSRLKEIRDEVLGLIQAAAPPELQLINELLAIEDEGQALEALHARQSEISQEVLEIMGELVMQLREAGNELAAQRLELLRAEGERLL